MKHQSIKKKLISFEDRISSLYEKKIIKGPVHLSGNNEDKLIKIFKKIKKKRLGFYRLEKSQSCNFKGYRCEIFRK